MVRLGICADGHEDDTHPRYYINHNHLGNIVSGRGYSLISPDQCYAASLSTLLQVNREARHAALRIYRVHLPFPRQDGEKVIQYVHNPGYDVIYVQPDIRPLALPPMDPRSVTVLINFLHDVGAYDPEDRGYAIYLSDAHPGLLLLEV